MKLLPESLGEMKVEVAMQSGRVTATLSATSEEAQASLREALPELRDRLAGRGLVVDSIEVKLVPRAAGEHPEAIRGGLDQDSGGLAGDSRGDAGSMGGREAREGGGQRGGAEGGEPHATRPVAEATGELDVNISSGTGWRLGLDLTV